MAARTFCSAWIIPEDRRSASFLALVDAKDQQVSVAKSRTIIATRCGVSEAEVQKIEREGLDREWPPW